MKIVHIIDPVDQSKVIVKAKFYDSFWNKFKGLMLVAALEPSEGVLLVNKRDSVLDSSIHMFFMRFPITTVWINSNLQIVDVKIAKPWRPVYLPQKPACYVLECHSSRVSDFKIGHTVQLKHV